MARVLCVVAVALLVALAAADDCDETTTCQNGGVCTSGQCDCEYSYTGTLCESVLTTGDDCVRDCDGLDDGNYQNCRRCTIFVNCTGGVLEEDFCDNDQEWHEADKMCKNGSSGTCELEVVDPDDIGPCASSNPCENGGECVNYEDLVSYYCDCAYSYTGELCESVLTTGDDCVRDCEDMDDGDYQSCRKCDKYVTCASGELTEESCEGDEEWDVSTESCEVNDPATCSVQKVDPEDIGLGGGSTVTRASLTLASGLVLLAMWLGC